MIYLYFRIQGMGFYKEINIINQASQKYLFKNVIIKHRSNCWPKVKYEANKV